MIVNTITFQRYKIEVVDQELRWCPVNKDIFLPENKLWCSSEIVSLFPYQDQLYISTLNGCLYRIGIPLMGNLFLEPHEIVRSKDNT